MKWEKKVIRLEKDWKRMCDENVRYTKSQVKWKRKHKLDFIVIIKNVCNTEWHQQRLNYGLEIYIEGGCCFVTKINI